MEIHPIIDPRLESGTAEGQLLFWDGRRWRKLETSELFWDDVNKRLGVKQSSPASELDVGGTVVATRQLIGGIQLS